MKKILINREIESKLSSCISKSKKSIFWIHWKSWVWKSTLIKKIVEEIWENKFIHIEDIDKIDEINQYFIEKLYDGFKIDKSEFYKQKQNFIINLGQTSAFNSVNNSNINIVLPDQENKIYIEEKTNDIRNLFFKKLNLSKIKADYIIFDAVDVMRKSEEKWIKRLEREFNKLNKKIIFISREENSIFSEEYIESIEVEGFSDEEVNLFFQTFLKDFEIYKDIIKKFINLSKKESCIIFYLQFIKQIYDINKQKEELKKYLEWFKTFDNFQDSKIRKVFD